MIYRMFSVYISVFAFRHIYVVNTIIIDSDCNVNIWIVKAIIVKHLV